MARLPTKHSSAVGTGSAVGAFAVDHTSTAAPTRSLVGSGSLNWSMVDSLVIAGLGVSAFLGKSCPAEIRVTRTLRPGNLAR